MAIAKTTALEILSEPLSLLLFLTAGAMAVLAPALHYHQFGESTRMARDAGLSALFTLGTIFAICGTLRSFRREIESGTLDMALAHPISRVDFFASKAIGCALALLIFDFIVFVITLTEVHGAWVGGAIAERTGEISRVWGPCLIAGVAVLIVPLLVGAMLNRFARFRFVLTAFMSAGIISLLLLVIIAIFNPRLLLGYLPVGALIATYSLMLLALSASFAVRYRLNVAVTLVILAILASLPIVGNYYLADALSRNGGVSWLYVAKALFASLPIFLFAIILLYETLHTYRRDFCR